MGSWYMEQTQMLNVWQLTSFLEDSNIEGHIIQSVKCDGHVCKKLYERDF